MKSFLLTLLLLITGVAQGITLDELQQNFSQQPVIRARFNQIRHIQGMAQPLHSSGEFIIARDVGLWWQQQQPFALTLVLDDHHMVQRMPGQDAVIITAQSNPQMFQFNHLLRAFFQADRTLLAQHFLMDFRDTGHQGWQLILTPKSSPLDKLFSHIQLQGQTYLNNLILNDALGDRTEITFHHQRQIPETLSDAERQHFVF